MKFRDTLGRGAALTAGIVYGAGMMYLLDPQHGRYRRAVIRDRFAGLTNSVRRSLNRQVRDLIHQSFGSVAEMRSKARAREVDDDTLQLRVRAQLGHVVSHIGSLQVMCRNGHVTLSGPILAGEREKIEKRLSATRGVRDWSLELREHDQAGSMPGLQGESPFQRREKVG